MTPKSVQIALIPFQDQRADKKTVGTTRNALGMKMADVIPNNSVPDWVMHALASELRNRGYVVVAGEGGTEVPESSSATVSGAILNVYCDMYINYTGQVSLVARVSRSGTEILNSHYSGEGSAGVAWGATEESYAQSLALALESAIEKFILDLDSALIAP
jgi:malate/lactate dehydrogenase